MKMTDFSKMIEDVALRIPSLPTIPRKNIFDILDIPRKETINSKILAYFLDPNEDHAYGELFRNSILAVLKSKNIEVDDEFYESVVSVVVEERTRNVKEKANRLKSIDIVLEGYKWCIIIENKIDHFLKNPLDIYLEHAQAKNKNLISIVLSVKQLDTSLCSDFINITHKDLINEVRKQIPFDTSIPELDIFYLREYFKNLESHYYNLNNQPKMNDIVTSLTTHCKSIIEIENKKKKAIEFVNREIKRVFEENNYVEKELWFVHPDDENLAFYVYDAKSIIETNSVKIYYEVWHGLKTKTTEDVIRKEIEIKSLSPCLYHDQVNDNLNMLKLVTFYEEKFINENINFGDKLNQVLNDIFFSENGIEYQALKKLNLGLKPAKQYASN